MAYKELNWRNLLFSKRRKEVHGDELESVNTGAGREEIERDYDRILFSAPVRRLADKTQVFPMEKNDSVRTRLTHSHEVSNLARSIGIRLAFNHKKEVFGESADNLNVERTIPALLAAIGLAHDLGNPPFGHQGENSIRQWFLDNAKYDTDEDFCKFDGNCQTFRLLTKLQILNDEYGLNLTYATLAGLMKYPEFSDTEGRVFKKFGIFQSERSIAEDVWDKTGLSEGIRHPMAYIMEACDDIAYSVIDAEDTVKKRYASFNDLMDYLSMKAGKDKVTNKVRDAALLKNEEFKKDLKLSPAELDELSMLMFRVIAISEMIQSITNTFVRNIPDMMSGKIKKNFGLIDKSNSKSLCESLKKFDQRYGFQHPSVLRLELQGNNYIRRTMDMLWLGIVNHTKEDPFAKYAYGRISENYRRVYDANREKDPERAQAHLLCDSISGMTESYLIALHDELEALRMEFGDDSDCKKTK